MDPHINYCCPKKVIVQIKNGVNKKKYLKKRGKGWVYMKNQGDC